MLQGPMHIFQAAQYDALVACWYYKTKYNRAAPYNVDSSVAAKFINKTICLPILPKLRFWLVLLQK